MVRMETCTCIRYQPVEWTAAHSQQLSEYQVHCCVYVYTCWDIAVYTCKIFKVIIFTYVFILTDYILTIDIF